MASGLNTQTKILASKLLIILAPVLIFGGINLITSGVLQAFNEFNIPAATSVCFNALIIFYYIFLINKFGVCGLTLSFLFGWISPVLVQLTFLYKQKYRFRFNINFKF